MTDDARQSAPATLRNRDAILDVLRVLLPKAHRGLEILEVASGTGEHALYFAQALPNALWQPSDPSPRSRASIAAWREAEGPANLLPPVDIDVRSAQWPADRADAIVAINMMHISPWEATVGLLAGARRLLPVGGLLYLYGPYRREGHPFAPSNAAFDADLKRRNSAWGIRSVEQVADAAGEYGLRLDRVVDMPANNLSLVLIRQAL